MNTAIVTLVNKRFLPGWAALLCSLKSHELTCEVPIVVLSDDPEVIEHPLIGSHAYHRVLIDAEELKRYYRVSKQEVRENKYRSDFGNYTFLKFQMFQDFGFDRNLFLDSDLIVLRNPIDLFTHSECDIFGMPPFVPAFEGIDRSDHEQVETVVRGLLRYPSEYAGNRFNTGVLSFGRKLMDRECRSELLNMAIERSFLGDQATIQEYLRKHCDIAAVTGHPRNNFVAGYLRNVSTEVKDEVLKEVNILHFADSTKPWEYTRINTHAARDLWHECFQNAVCRFGIDDIEIARSDCLREA